jgi:outer membrane protein assembly factor BamB
MRTARAARILAVAAALTTVLTSTHPAGASTTATAVAYQGSTTHEGGSDDSVRAPLQRGWNRSFSGQLSYPVAADGLVFVTSGASSSVGTWLWALDESSGATVWGPVDLGGAYIAGLAYDDGTVFTVNYYGVLRAFTAGTGAARWTTQLPGQWSFTSPPTAAGGMVYTSGAGSGGTLYGVSQADGSITWKASVANGDHSSPAVTDTTVYVSYACNQAYAFDRLTGALQWHHNTFCSGGGGRTVAVHAGQVFTRDYFGNLVLDAATGAVLRSYSATVIPAFDGDTMVALNGSTLQGLGPDGTLRWSFTGDGSLSSAPVVSSGVAYVGSTRGSVFGVDTVTGRQVWSGSVGTAIAAPDEHNGWNLTGLAVADGHLLVPAGNTLTAFSEAGPTIVATAVGTQGSNGWFTSHVVVHFTCTPGAQQLATACPSDVALHQQGADQVVTGSVTDVAGRTASTSISVSIDTGAPTVALSNSAITIGNDVYGTAADKVSGIDQVTVTFTSAAGGVATVTAELSECSSGPDGCRAWRASVPPGLLGLGPDGAPTAWSGTVTAEARDVAGLTRATSPVQLVLLG